MVAINGKAIGAGFCLRSAALECFGGIGLAFLESSVASDGQKYVWGVYKLLTLETGQWQILRAIMRNRSAEKDVAVGWRMRERSAQTSFGKSDQATDS